MGKRVDDGFLPSPIHVLQNKFSVVCYENVDEIILNEAARLAAESDLDFSIVIDEGRMKEVLELGLKAFWEKEVKNNG